MTRIFTDGAEMGDTLFWDTIVGTVTVVSSTPTPRSGAYCYKLAGGATLTKNIVATPTVYLRFGLYLTNPSVSNDRIPAFRNSTTELVSIRWNEATNKIDVYVGSTYTASSTNSFLANAWYLIESKITISDTVGVIQVKVDGNLEVDYSGDTKPSTQTTIDNIYFKCNTTYHALDDLGLNDALGSSNNSWLGNGHIISLTPTSDESVSWYPSTGTVHYSLVDEVPSNSDTDYVYITGTLTTTLDKFGCSDYTLTGTSILGVWAESRAKKTTADDGILRMGVRVPDVLVDTLHSGTPLTTSYARVVGDRLTVNPKDDLAWVEADLSGTLLCICPGTPFV